MCILLTAARSITKTEAAVITIKGSNAESSLLVINYIENVIY
jgi:hypothetical protein